MLPEGHSFLSQNTATIPIYVRFREPQLTQITETQDLERFLNQKGLSRCLLTIDVIYETDDFESKRFGGRLVFRMTLDDARDWIDEETNQRIMIDNILNYNRIFHEGRKNKYLEENPGHSLELESYQIEVFSKENVHYVFFM